MVDSPVSKEHLFVISGCSGSGKSTLLAALAERGEKVVVEPGREIVKEQLRSGGDGLPWLNTQRFVDLCAERTIRDFESATGQVERTFFDRSFIDVATASEWPGLVAPEALKHALQTKRYASFVFISEPWEALFHPDEERRHTFLDAVAEHERLVPAYRRHGYEIVFLPQVPVVDRVSFVLSTLSSRANLGVSDLPPAPRCGAANLP